VKVVGIDLAAQPEKTGVVVLTTQDGARPLVRPWQGAATDDALIDAAVDSDVVAVDAPLGWPVEFVAAIAAHERLEPWLGKVDRTNLCFRRTDEVVRARTGRWPLSVSADKLGIVAMRCALLQEGMAVRAWDGRRQPRDGSGQLIEAYPAAALKLLGLPASGYKGPKPESRELRRRILRGLAVMSDLEQVFETSVASDNHLDAVVSALVGWMAATGRTDRPVSAVDQRLALIEGWIHLPRDPHLAGAR
jgi:predicted nuclease with RNAse H fold